VLHRSLKAPDRWQDKLSQASDRGLSIDEESELDDLYAAPLDQFIKLRNDAASRLKKEGNEEAAARVAALKKPSVSAWAVNQLARTGSIDFQRLIKAGEALEQAQSRAISGGDSSGFEAARREESAATNLLRAATKQVLPSASPAILDRVVSTLRAGAATPQGRVLIKQGRLSEDLEPTGFGAFSGISLTEAPTQAGPAADDRTKHKDKVESLRKLKREADEKAKGLEAEARDLEEAARAAESLAKRALRAAEAARKTADAAAEDARSIKAELDDL